MNSILINVKNLGFDICVTRKTLNNWHIWIESLLQHCVPGTKIEKQKVLRYKG